MIKVTHIDHLVLTVKDVDASCKFYDRVLGMQKTSFKKDRRAVVFGNQKINFHEHGKEFEPRSLHPTPGSADLCFVTDDPPFKVIDHLEKCGVKIVEGPVKRVGAAGTITSIYIRDPDENLLEISSYGKADG
jgi:catechol 2,3-dioxygenase-like lactoylglutathione lyase family enzyme